MPEPPSGTAVSRGRSSWLISSGVVLSVAAVLVAVWALGGFHKRTDLLQLTAAGTLISTGPYEFTFTGATAQKKTDFDNEPYWELTAIGTGRTTGDIAIAPDYDDSGTFVSQDVRSGVDEPPESLRHGSTRSFTEGTQFTPGLPPVPILVDFKYPQSYVPDVTLRFVVFDLEFSDSSLLGDQGKTWHKTNYGFDYRLPVRLLPEEPH